MERHPHLHIKGSAILSSSHRSSPCVSVVPQIGEVRLLPQPWLCSPISSTSTSPRRPKRSSPSTYGEFLLFFSFPPVLSAIFWVLLGVPAERLLHLGFLLVLGAVVPTSLQILVVVYVGPRLRSVGEHLLVV